jgi:serine protease Do
MRNWPKSLVTDLSLFYCSPADESAGLYILYMKIFKLLLITLTFCIDVYGQNAAIEKAYPATVRVWAYDTTTRQQMSAQFSAVVVTPQGDIFTAAHTTIPGTTYKVMFPDGTATIAVALGKIELADDPMIPDVSMMKIITQGNWPYAEIGYSSSLKLHQPCISIAYPESLNQSLPCVRFGYITSLRDDRGFLQSTCIMEPGDSGGPLFDCLGRVIGIHSAIGIPESENHEIPVDLYRKYRTALGTAKKYNALPDITDTIGHDTLEAPMPQYTLPESLPAACLLITSKITDKEEKIYGTVFSHGYIVSKSSMVGNEPEIHVNGKVIKAVVLSRNRDKDLVLLKVHGKLQEGVIPSRSVLLQRGQFLISTNIDTANIISVVGSLPLDLPRISSAGFLGASIAYKAGPLLITFVRRNSPAAENNLKEGDELISINGVTIDKAEKYYAELQKYWPDDTITMQLKRQGALYTKQIVLAWKPVITATHPAEMFPGGKSIRRDGFTSVFVHDAVLTPNRCGGPVFDMTGNFRGINIARYSRSATIVIPADIVYEFLKQ